MLQTQNQSSRIQESFYVFSQRVLICKELEHMVLYVNVCVMLLFIRKRRDDKKNSLPSTYTKNINKLLNLRHAAEVSSTAEKGVFWWRWWWRLCIYLCTWCCCGRRQENIFKFIFIHDTFYLLPFGSTQNSLCLVCLNRMVRFIKRKKNNVHSGRLLDAFFLYLY